MEIVVTEFVEKVKTEMKQFTKTKDDEMSQLKKHHKADVKRLKAQHKKDKTSKEQAQKELSELEKKFNEKLKSLDYFVDMYSVSKMLPVQFEGVIINYKLYSAFVKKIEGFNTTISVQSNEVTISYWKSGTRNQGKGVLKLYDLSEYFQGFKHIPEAKRVHSYGEET